jgi:predicted AlkP superfamily pyrophosphatase or phosphodiesterase
MQKSILSALLFLILFSSSCQRKALPAGTVEPAVKTEISDPQYLLLISLDGFRWDYAERFQPPNLIKFISSGVQAESMLSSFPSKTFTNHYTIATGMYPNNHGLVDNSFFDSDKNLVFGMGKRELVEDGSWYGGTPIWVQAAKAGMPTASFFFVGSEADVQGVRPTYFYRYDGAIPNDQRVQQVLDWLKLPPAERPRIITLYFSDMDDVGHRHGPNDDDKLREKLLALDASLGRLFEGIDATGLPVNVVIVSDHGMSPISVSQLLPIEQLEDNERYKTVNNGALAHIYLNSGTDGEAVYRDLKAMEKNYRVYRTAEVPYFETPPTNPRWGEFIAIPDEGYYFVNARTMGFRKTGGQAEIGEHGFDPERREMHGIFYAKGPALKAGTTIPSFKNIHVYPLMCRILGLDIPLDIDGNPEVLDGVLRRRP